jgi:uncharacterized protein YbjQ (UPF0145 family)
MGDFMSKTVFVVPGLVAFVALAALAVCAVPAQAEDDLSMVTVADALASPDAQGKLDGTVKFYFGDTKHPAVAQKFGEYITNKKTNSVGKSDAKACTWTFLSAVIELQERAHKLGANGVINIHSYYKKKDVGSATQVECYTGLLMSGVALKGDFVKLSGK